MTDIDFSGLFDLEHDLNESIRLNSIQVADVIRQKAVENVKGGVDEKTGKPVPFKHVLEESILATQTNSGEEEVGSVALHASLFDDGNKMGKTGIADPRDPNVADWLENKVGLSADAVARMRAFPTNYDNKGSATGFLGKASELEDFEVQNIAEQVFREKLKL